MQFYGIKKDPEDVANTVRMGEGTLYKRILELR